MNSLYLKPDRGSIACLKTGLRGEIHLSLNSTKNMRIKSGVNGVFQAKFPNFPFDFLQFGLIVEVLHRS